MNSHSFSIRHLKNGGLQIQEIHAKSYVDEIPIHVGKID